MVRWADGCAAALFSFLFEDTGMGLGLGPAAHVRAIYGNYGFSKRCSRITVLSITFAVFVWSSRFMVRGFVAHGWFRLRKLRHN